jgi:hypothetical protein
VWTNTTSRKPSRKRSRHVLVQVDFSIGGVVLASDRKVTQHRPTTASFQRGECTSGPNTSSRTPSRRKIAPHHPHPTGNEAVMPRVHGRGPAAGLPDKARCPRRGPRVPRKRGAQNVKRRSSDVQRTRRWRTSKRNVLPARARPGLVNSRLCVPATDTVHRGSYVLLHPGRKSGFRA